MRKKGVTLTNFYFIYLITFHLSLSTVAPKSNADPYISKVLKRGSVDQINQFITFYWIKTLKNPTSRMQVPGAVFSSTDTL